MKGLIAKRILLAVLGVFICDVAATLPASAGWKNAPLPNKCDIQPWVCDVKKPKLF